MPTTIDSAGITFNDATSLTSAVLAANSVGATQITNGSVTAAKLGTTEQTRIAKAWVNFNGTTSPGTIRSSYNVSSVTKNATGTYTVNFSTPIADANYTGAATHSGASSVSFASVASVLFSQTSAQLICTSVAGASIGATFDPPQVFLQVFGN
jgi:hypothetical protein